MNLAVGRLGILDELGRFKVAAVFGVVSVEVADAIGRLAAAAPAEVVLNRDFGGAMGLGSLWNRVRVDLPRICLWPIRTTYHDGFVAHDCGCGVLLLLAKHVVEPRFVM